MYNTFVNSIDNQEARTANDMRARKSTASACVDLFFKIGASRGKDIIPAFTAAYAENDDLALRIALWARDVRGGAGDRKLFRDILQNLEIVNPNSAALLAAKIPEVGRWDDMLVFTDAHLKGRAFATIKKALIDGNGLCAKWLPRKGKVAVELRKYLGFSPKRYRKTLVGLTNVVETQMCSNKWNEIDYEKVPSLASARYKKAFERHGHAFAAYVEKVVKGEAKVNASAVYPHDVLKTLLGGYRWTRPSATELDHIRGQWAALPNYMGDSSIFPMIDVSGSMQGLPIEVAVALGLYVADKNKGVFKDAFLTFSEHPEIQVARGDIISKVQQVSTANWGMNTNLIAGLDLILNTAINGRVAQQQMPDTLVIFSDMQFDSCATFDDSAMNAVKRRFEAAGYQTPNIVFWNLNAYDNAPAKFNDKGVALVSGFSPAIMKSILAADFESFTPEGIMRAAVMVPRYNLS